MAACLAMPFLQVLAHRLCALMIPTAAFSPGPSRQPGSPASAVGSSPVHATGNHSFAQSPLLAPGSLGSGSFATPSALSPAHGSTGCVWGGFPGLALSPGMAGSPLAVHPGLGSHVSQDSYRYQLPGLAFSPGMAGGPLAVPPGLGSRPSQDGKRSAPRMPQAATTVGSLQKAKTDSLLTRLCGKHWHPCVLTQRTPEENACALALSLNWFSDTILDGAAKGDTWIRLAVDMYKNIVENSGGNRLDDKSLDEIVKEGKVLIAEHQRIALEEEAAKERRAQAQQQALELMTTQHAMFNPAALHQQHHQAMMQSHFMQQQMLQQSALFSTPVAALHGQQRQAPMLAASGTAALQQAGFPTLAQQPPLGTQPSALTAVQPATLTPTAVLNKAPTLTPTLTRSQVANPEIQILRVRQDATGQVFAEAFAKRRRLDGDLDDYVVVGGTTLRSQRLSSEVSMWELLRNTDEPWPPVTASTLCDEKTAENLAEAQETEATAEAPEENEAAEEKAENLLEHPEDNDGHEATSEAQGEEGEEGNAE